MSLLLHAQATQFHASPAHYGARSTLRNRGTDYHALASRRLQQTHRLRPAHARPGSTPVHGHEHVAALLMDAKGREHARRRTATGDLRIRAPCFEQLGIYALIELPLVRSVFPRSGRQRARGLPTCLGNRHKSVLRPLASPVRDASPPHAIAWEDGAQSGWPRQTSRSLCAR